jgi:hypothetical protein
MAIQRLTSHLRGLSGLDAGQVADLMQAEGYGYVYATEGGRQFDAVRLRDSSRFEVLYHNDRVTILRLR